MSDLESFLRARLDEDERVARAATQGRWLWADPDTSSFPQYSRSLLADQDSWRVCENYCRWSGEANLHRGEPGKPGHEHRVTETVVSGWGYDSCGLDIEEVDADHITRHDPARVLADVAAKRALLRVLDGDPFDALGAEGAYELLVIRHLAAAYASHPDYQQDWAP